MPAAAMPAVIAAAVLAGPVQATARVELPAKTPAQVLALVAGSHVQKLSGTLEQSASLGLPQLPDLGPGSPGSSSTSTSPATGAENTLSAANISQLMGFLTEPHTVRIYLDGAANQRVQVLDKMAERDLIRHGTTVWAYDSAANTATELSLPNPRLPKAEAPKTETPAPATTPKPHSDIARPGDFEQTPATLAADFLKDVDASTQVSVGPNTKVAKRAAYDLELVPRTSQTLVGKVSIAVDAVTGLPLRVTVTARGQDKATFELGFSQLSLSAPPASTFLFTPPPGATVARPAAPVPMARDAVSPQVHKAPQAHQAPKVTATGTGWTTIVEAPAGTVPASLSASPALAQLLQAVPGGYALSTTLFNVLVAPDGGVYAGAVPLAALQQAAAAK
ncbi:DUF2092 domain-containing protein [Arthrobacter livingstonensis]|uniref:DUF2092 domain-containing protein n=2 Tax=Arthrobacter livingstonensis TaxID=670078 RepID=A0A2V5LQ71_9MICC|nr:DUF2092 domain-containing protein [Arthrobacter livingstonensis]